MLKKALVAAALTLVSGVALAHDYRGYYYDPPVRHYYYPPVRHHYAPPPRVIYRPVPVYPAPIVVPAPRVVVPAPVVPGIVVRLHFPL